MNHNAVAASDFGKVAVFCGGVSAERDISLVSGQSIYRALLRKQINAELVDVSPGNNIVQQLSQAYDRVFIALHGRWGENGIVQGALESADIPYTGSGVLASALAMDKIKTKRIWKSMGLPVAKDYLVLTQDDLQFIEPNLDFPVFVKPVSEGSSVGGSKVLQADDLLTAYENAVAVDSRVMVEQFIAGSEVTVSILGETALPAIRMHTTRDFYDYKAKYQKGFTEYHCPAGLSDEMEQRVRALALEAYQAIGCAGWGRVDLMLDENDSPYLLEVNTVPGMTETSLVPQAAASVGMQFDDLVLKILEATL